MTGGTTFTDFSDELSVLSAPSQARMNSPAYVFGESAPMISYGKREPMEVVVRGVYQEATTSLFYKAHVSFTTACGELFAIAYSPGGCTTDNRRLRTSTTRARITNLVYPEGDASSAEVMMWEATILTDELTESVWA